jgi:hypothetical protein
MQIETDSFRNKCEDTKMQITTDPFRNKCEGTKMQITTDPFRNKCEGTKMQIGTDSFRKKCEGTKMQHHKITTTKSNRSTRLDGRNASKSWANEQSMAFVKSPDIERVRLKERPPGRAGEPGVHPATGWNVRPRDPVLCFRHRHGI